MNLLNNTKISTGTRLAAMFLDHLFMTFIALAFFIPQMIVSFAGAFSTNHEQTNTNTIDSLAYLSMVGFALYFCKDSINGRSIAKRILKLQVVDNSTGQAASPLKCLVRNLFLILWPIETIIALTNPSRRIGDRVAGTKLVAFDPSIEQPKPNTGQAFIALLIAYTPIFLLMLLMQGLIWTMNGGKVDYVESSYNPKASKEMEQLLTDSLGQYLTPNVKIYDQVRNEDLKYISSIMQLKENYLENESDYEQLNAMTTRLIYSKYPDGAFTGAVKYIYQTSGKMQSQSTRIGADIKPKRDE